MLTTRRAGQTARHVGNRPFLERLPALLLPRSHRPKRRNSRATHRGSLLPQGQFELSKNNLNRDQTMSKKSRSICSGFGNVLMYDSITCRPL